MWDLLEMLRATVFHRFDSHMFGFLHMCIKQNIRFMWKGKRLHEVVATKWKLQTPSGHCKCFISVQVEGNTNACIHYHPVSIYFYICKRCYTVFSRPTYFPKAVYSNSLKQCKSENKMTNKNSHGMPKQRNKAAGES